MLTFIFLWFLSITLYAAMLVLSGRKTLFVLSSVVQIVHVLLAFSALRLWGLLGILPATLLLVNSVNVARLSSHHYDTPATASTVHKQWMPLMIASALSILSIELLSLELDSILAYTSMAAALFALAGLITTIKTMNKTHRGVRTEASRARPSVTLAIPARNETHALTQSIDAALSSRYEKLEIIVLDDCSQDQTPKLIKKYAHAGVRFVQGRPPEEGWLGKNNAYKVLLQEASGHYVIFAGVDIIFSPSSVSEIVAHMQDEHLQMASFVPTRGSLDVAASILQPLRYWWQFAAPWFLGQNKPALSSCVAVERHSLVELQLLDKNKDAVVPEAPMATYFARHGGYRFMHGGFFGLSTRKRLSSQFETAQRTLYPQLGKNLLLFSAKLIGMVIFAMQPVIAIYALANSSSLLLTLSLAAIGFFFTSFAIVQRTVSPRSWLLTLPMSLVVWPIEVALALWSFYGYELGEVRWKDRNICIPVMGQTTPD